MHKENYESLELVITEFDTESIITTSLLFPGGSGSGGSGSGGSGSGGSGSGGSGSGIPGYPPYDSYEGGGY